ncbi:MAG: FAD-dependent oxidoreductase, partial [Muribaculaceae bacterium]|nr:FAD-dependent oxidoreductase [Muribaculaceae bacterium]
KYVVEGLARDFYRRVGKHYGRFEQWVFEPSVAEAIFNDYQRDAGVEVLYGRYAAAAPKSANGAIDHLVTVSMTDPADTVIVTGKMFIDCTYEGDLLPLSGVSYTVGREANSVYGETVNGVQDPVYHQFPDGVDPYRIKGDPSSGLLWGISDKPVAESGTGDRKVQAYNYRIALTDSAENRVEITRPSGYDSTRYELMLRLNEVKPWRTLNDMFIWSLMPGRKTDINNRGAFSTDMIGANFDYPEASWPERKRIIADHEAYTKGLLYFLGHDERVPEHIRSQMLQWGYPADEYVDNGNWTPQLYIRESRRMVSDMVMTQHHCQGRATVSDPVAMAAYTMDSHNCDRHVINGMVKNEGDVEVGGFPPYPISYRSLVPARGECPNLLVPVCLSASHIAYGSIRMEPVFMDLAQVAALAASQAIDRGIAVQ